MDETTTLFDQDEPDKPNMGFLSEKYSELIRIKSNKDFGYWGFSPGGPYHGWIQTVKEVYNQQKPVDFRAIDAGKPYVPTGVGQLLSLGLAYVSSKGKETKVTAFFKEEIEKILSGKPGPEWPSEKKPSSTFAEFNTLIAMVLST